MSANKKTERSKIKYIETSSRTGTSENNLKQEKGRTMQKLLKIN